MEKNSEEMLQRLRDTVEDKPRSEMSEREKDVSTMTLGKLRSRVRGENQQLWRQRQHRVLNSGLGMNEYFANMPYWERHEKANKVIRDFAITALKGNHTNKMDLMRAMHHKMDSPIGSAAADAVLENLYTYHDVDKYGRWTPKKEYENETLEDMVGRVLPHGRACIAGESHRSPQTYT
jgi:hypothetical protein